MRCDKNRGQSHLKCEKDLTSIAGGVYLGGMGSSAGSLQEQRLAPSWQPARKQWPQSYSLKELESVWERILPKVAVRNVALPTPWFWPVRHSTEVPIKSTWISDLQKLWGHTHLICCFKLLRLWYLLEQYWKRNSVNHVRTVSRSSNISFPYHSGRSCTFLAVWEYHFETIVIQDSRPHLGRDQRYF